MCVVKCISRCRHRYRTMKFRGPQQIVFQCHTSILFRACAASCCTFYPLGRLYQVPGTHFGQRRDRDPLPDSRSLFLSFFYSISFYLHSSVCTFYDFFRNVLCAKETYLVLFSLRGQTKASRGKRHRHVYCCSMMQ